MVLVVNILVLWCCCYGKRSHQAW